MRADPVITIDGPVGAGKTTVARALARRLGLRLLDTGSMYRALAWSVVRAGLPADDTPALRRHLESIELDAGDDGVSVNGRDVTAEIRTPEISDLTSRLSALPPVRDKVTPLQRRLAAAGRVVLEGRDTGTVVCPDADVKFYVDATPEERARRRHAELQAAGVAVDLPAVLGDLRARDRRDTTRTLVPLRPAEDAIVIDTTHLGIEEVVDRMVRAIEERCCTRS